MVSLTLTMALQWNELDTASYAVHEKTQLEPVVSIPVLAPAQPAMTRL